jgi:hypothetical protein
MSKRSLQVFENSTSLIERRATSVDGRDMPRNRLVSLVRELHRPIRLDSIALNCTELDGFLSSNRAVKPALRANLSSTSAPICSLLVLALACVCLLVKVSQSLKNAGCRRTAK